MIDDVKLNSFHRVYTTESYCYTLMECVVGMHSIVLLLNTTHVCFIKIIVDTLEGSSFRVFNFR